MSLALVTDALGEGAGALAGDVHEARIAADLVEHGQDGCGAAQAACGIVLVRRSRSSLTK